MLDTCKILKPGVREVQVGQRASKGLTASANSRPECQLGVTQLLHRGSERLGISQELAASADRLK
jgi:hypothetical protein